MIKSIGKLTLAAILAASVLGMPLAVSAQSTNAPAPAPKPKAVRFGGTLGAVDKAASTLTVDHKNGEKMTITVTSDTKIMKGGKPATLDDAMVGDRVNGSYIKTDDGKMTAKTVSFGGKAPVAPGGTNAPAK